MIGYKSRSEEIADYYRVKHGLNALSAAYKDKQSVDVLLHLYFVPR